MTEQKKEYQDTEISQEELDRLDDNLLEIEILYRSRCVTPPRGTNVVVREIDDKK